MFRFFLSLFIPKSKPNPALVVVLERFGGGVQKRIDENRELLELLQERAPGFLKENDWVEGWLANNDEFFVGLEQISKSVGVELRNPDFYPIRPWPGSERAQTDPVAIAESEKLRVSLRNPIFYSQRP